MIRLASPIVVCTALLAAGPVVSQGQVDRRPVQPPSAGPLVPSATAVADSLFMAADLRGAVSVLSAHLDAAPNDFEALWRRVRSTVALAILTEDRSEKLRLLRGADRDGERLLSLRGDDPVALEWAVAAKGRLAIDDHNPVTTARLGKEVWKLTGDLLAKEPANPMGNDARGVLIQEIRRLSWGERALARILIGGDVMGAAHWSDGERHLQHAVEGDPGMVVYRMDLGDTYRLQGKDAQALEVYQSGLALPDRSPVDAFYKRRIRDRINAMKAREGSDS